MARLQVWTNQHVPRNDGGISLGQAALAAFDRHARGAGLMHELSIALSIIDVVEEETARLGGRHVRAVHLRVGRLSGIVKEALLASYELACEQTVLAGSHLVIEDVPVVAHARPATRAVRSGRSRRWSADVCGTPAIDIVEGRELLVTALEMEP